MWYTSLNHVKNKKTSFLLKAFTATLLLASAGALAAEAEAEDVSIVRDEYGVPHVVAKTSDAVMFGAGYALAQDRLASMELSRRSAVGRR
ncbi:penicillin acylase family protein, partial [Pseudocolwellia agarivorans]|uniref:penicillin acylase family protein n=1 Tax=Pseudocolwellia agarivorans TaxID=1911682 RepID=UPI001115A020